jgi:hypothetical protein
MAQIIRALAWTGLLAGLVGCSQNYSDQPAQQALAEKGLKPATPALPQAQSDQGQSAGQRQSLGGISAVPPQGWQRVSPSSSMRLAEYRLAGGAEGEATLAVFYFGSGQGGGLEENIERWYGQFTQPDGRPTRERARRWEQEVEGVRLTLVDLSGTYNSGMGQPQGALEDYRMIGAIAQARAGLFFFKLTGPRPTVARWEESFAQYMASIRPE